MQILRKTICSVIVFCLLMSLSAMTVFADHTRVVDLNEDELYEHIMDLVISQAVDMNKVKADTSVYNTFDISVISSEIKDFIAQYEPLYDDDITDARDSFYTYVDDLQKKEEISREVSDGIIVEYSKNQKSYWTYDQSQDRYVCKDTNGKLLKSIPKYHLDDEASLPQTSTSSNTSDISRNIDNDSNSHNTTPARQNSITDTVSIVEDTQVSEEIVYESAEESSLSQSQSNEMVAEETYIDDTSGNQTSRDRKTIVSGVIDEETAMETFVPDIAEKESNNFVQVVLIIIGILVIIGIVIIIVMLKRKAANKNEE